METLEDQRYFVSFFPFLLIYSSTSLSSFRFDIYFPFVFRGARLGKFEVDGN